MVQQFVRSLQNPLWRRLSNKVITSLQNLEFSLIFLWEVFLCLIFWGGWELSHLLWRVLSSSSPFFLVRLSLGVSFWPSLALLALHSHDLPHRLSALRHQSPCPSQVAAGSGDRRVKEHVSAFLCYTALGSSLPMNHSSLTSLQLPPYMALSWLPVHLLRGITWHA